MARHAAPALVRPRAARRALGGLACILLVAGMPVRAAADPAPPVHRAPVDAPIVDPFRAPTSRWGSGNRGIEYGTVPGTPVGATADGVVVFAGTVAGSRHVTVRHGDDVRTSYSFLDTVAVVVGQRVEQGQVVGTTADRLHLGARLGDDYFDPASLFAPDPVQVRLVPFEIPPGFGPSGEHRAIRQLVGALGDAAAWVVDTSGDRVAGGVGLAGDWIRTQGRPLLRTFAHYGVPFPVRAATGIVTAARDAHRVALRACTPDGVAGGPPAGRRLALRIGGLGSTSDDAAIDDLDLGALGYDEADVARFSYAGGTTPGRGAAFADVAASDYGAADSQRDLWASGSALADLLEAVVAAEPGATVDLFAHSQGGLVLRAALVVLEERHGPEWLAHLGAAVTLGTPHDGADLATFAHAVQSTVAGDRVLEVGEWLTGLDADAPASVQLSETSDFVAELDRRSRPGAVELTSIAARGDLVVPVPRTAAPGATQVVVSVDGLLAHDALPGSPEAHREVALALAGHPPGCRSFDTAFRDHLQGEAISLVEDVAGSVTWGYLATRGVFRG